MNFNFEIRQKCFRTECSNYLHFSYRSISVDKMVEIVIVHIEVLSLMNREGGGSQVTKQHAQMIKKYT